MDYATKELTQSLQDIAAREAQSVGERSEKTDAEHAAYSASALSLPTGVDRFLETRRDFQERTRDVSMGCY